MTQHLRIAELDPEAVAKIRALEDDLGMHIMAFGKPLRFAGLLRDELAKVTALEQELGVTLIVYEE